MVTGEQHFKRAGRIMGAAIWDQALIGVSRGKDRVNWGSGTEPQQIMI